MTFYIISIPSIFLCRVRKKGSALEPIDVALPGSESVAWLRGSGEATQGICIGKNMRRAVRAALVLRHAWPGDER